MSDEIRLTEAEEEAAIEAAQQAGRERKKAKEISTNKENKPEAEE